MTEKKENVALPSIQQLIQDAWDLFTKTWTVYLQLIGLSFAFFSLALLIGVLLSIPVFIDAASNHFHYLSHLTPFTIAALVLLALWFILLFLSIIALDVIFPIVNIMVLQGKKTGPILDLFRQAKRYFWPLFLTLLFSGLLVMGGMILLVIPGFLIAFFFAFVVFDVVVENQSGTTALKRSYYMVKTHFWEVLGRLLVLEVAGIVISSVLGRLAAQDGMLGLVQLLFSVFVSWYTRAYVFLLYKEVRSRTIFPEQISLRWVWIVSALGWGILILVFVAFGIGIAHLPHVPSHPNAVHGNAV